MDKKPWELDYSATDADNAGVKPWQQYGAAPKKGLGFVAKSMQTAGDLGVSLLSGAVSVPDSLVGLADATSTFLGVNNDKGNAVRKTLANDDGAVGFNPAQAKRAIDNWHSDDYKDKQQQFAQAKGVLAKTGVALSNPSLVANTVAESLPAMGAGGVAGMGARGLAAKAGVNLSARAAGAIGEGTLMAGQQAANIQEQTGGLTQGQAGAALLTGALGGGISVMGARAAQKMGVGDIDTALVSGSAGKIAPQSVPLAAIKGAVSEGLLEELPQSVVEQLIGNIATGKPWHDNLDGAAVMGALSGAAMGGMFGARQGKGWGKAGEYTDKAAEYAGKAGSLAVDAAGAAGKLAGRAGGVGVNAAGAVNKAFWQGAGKVSRAAGEVAGKVEEGYREARKQTTKPNEDEQQSSNAVVDATQPLALPSPESLAMRDALDAGLAQLRARRMGENRAEYDARMEREAEKVAEFEQRFVDDWQSGNILKNTGKSEYDTWARAVASRAFAPPNVEQEAQSGEQEVKLSEKMGLNPDAGAMQAAAALAVDSGASPVAPPLSPEELAEKEAREDWEDRQWYEQQLAYEQYEREQEQEAADWARDWAVAVQRGMADGYSASQASQMYDDARSQAAPPQEVQTVPTPAPQSKQQAAAEPQSEAAPSVRRQPMAQALPKAQQVDTEPTAAASSAQSPAGVDNAAPVAVKSEVAKEKAVPVEAVRQTQPEVSAAPEPLATQAESSAMPKEAVDAPEAAETNAAPTEAEMVVEPAKPTAKKAAKSKGRDAQRQLVSDWGMRVDGWAVNAEHQGAKETDNGVVGGVKDAFLNDAKAYLTAVQHELADMGFVPQLDKKGKPHKVAVNKGGTGTSGDVYLMMQRDDGMPVYVTVNAHSGSRPTVMFRVGNSGANHHTHTDMSAGGLAQNVAEIAGQYSFPARKTPQPEPTKSEKPETVKETTDNGKQQSEARAGAVHSGTGNQSERVSELAENGTGTLESVSAENVSSVSSGNPLILEEMSLRKQVNDLEAQKLRHERNLYRVRSGIRRTQVEMENDQRRIGELEKLLKAKTPAKLDITIGKKRFTHDMEQARTEAGKALLSQVRTVAGSSAVQGKTVGQYGDFSLRLVPDALVLDTVYLHLDYADTDLVLEMKRDDAAGGVLTRIRNLIENTRHELEKHQHRLEQNRASLPKMQKQLSEWDGAERLAQVREEHARVLALLKPKSGGQAQAAKPNMDNQKENESDKPSFDVADAAPVNNPTVAAYRAAIRRAVGKENMRHVRIISRKRAKEILPVKHHAYIERLRGWHSKGKVVLVADNIASARVAQFTAWHELGHRGVAVSGWSDWAKALNQAYLGNPLFRQIADTILAWRADTHDKAGRDKLAAAEEALVELYAAKRTGDFSLLESRYGVKVSERFRGWQSRLMQVLARLREIAGRLFGFGDSFSDGDLLRLMKRLDKAEGLDMAKAVPALDLAAPEYGQRAGLFDLPPVPVTRIDADSLPKGFKDMKLLADKLLRDLQQSPVGTLHNDDMGWDLVVGKKDRQKMGDNENLAHHTSQAVAGVVDLVRNAVLAETHKDERHNNNHVQAVHRLYAPVEIAGKLYRAKLTVKDYVLNSGVKRKNLHAIETVEIENAPMGTLPSDAQVQGRAQPTSGRSISIADLLRGASLNNGNPFDSFDDVAFDLEIDENGFLNNPDKVSQAVNQAIRRHVRTGGVRRALGDKWTDGLKVSLQFLGRRQLTEIYRQLLPQLDHYGELADKYSADGNRAMIRSDKLVSGWAKLKDKDALADLMHDATLAQVDADSAVKPELPADFKAWLPLRQRFNRLSPEAQAVYRQARDDYRSHFDGVQAAMEARLRRLGAKAGAVERVRQRFSEGMKGVYFPLARFGNYVVAAKNANGKVISIGRAETMKEARTLRESYLRDFPAKDGFSVGQVQLAKEYAQSRDAVGTGFLKNALDALSELNLSNEQFAGIEDTLHQLYLQSLPDLSWAKHGIHRKGTKGFSNDAMRAYARNMVHGAEYLAKLRYGDLMTAALDDMQDFSDKKRDDKDFNQPVAQRVIDEMRKRHEVMLNPNAHPLASALTGAGFVWYLGASPAAALVNLSQTPLVAFPMMAAKWGGKKALAELSLAAKQTTVGKNNIRAQLNADEQAAFDRAEGDGTIDIGQVHDLIRESGGASSGKTARGFHAFMKAAGWMFQGAERFNRQATFVAAYRLARQAGADGDAAFAQAKDMVFRSHFDYSTENRPRVMQGNWQRVIFLFKQYSQNMIYTLLRNAYQSFKGLTEAEKKEARKNLLLMLSFHSLAAGVLGLPLVGTVLPLLSLLGSDDDEPWDAETALRLWLNEAFGNTAGEVVAKGASRLTPWDVSGRVGLNNLIFPDVQDGLQGRRWAESFAAGMSGPVVGLGISWADGANKIADGDWQRGLESMLPVALRNALKSWRLASEGHIDKSGVVVKDEIGWGGVLGQSVGFSPSELRLAMEGKAAVMKADRELNSRRSELLTKFARASMDGDTEKMAQTRKEIAAFNRKHPNRAITVSHLLQSVRNRRRRITQAQDGVYLPRNHRDALGAGSFAHDD